MYKLGSPQNIRGRRIVINKVEKIAENGWESFINFDLMISHSYFRGGN